MTKVFKHTPSSLRRPGTYVGSRRYFNMIHENWGVLEQCSTDSWMNLFGERTDPDMILINTNSDPYPFKNQSVEFITRKKNRVTLISFDHCYRLTLKSVLISHVWRALEKNNMIWLTSWTKRATTRGTHNLHFEEFWPILWGSKTLHFWWFWGPKVLLSHSQSGLLLQDLFVTLEFLFP